MKSFSRVPTIAALFMFLAACTASTPATPTPTSSMAWIEEAVTFPSGANQLSGLLTLLNKPGAFPAVVLISGSANQGSLLRSGISNEYLMDQAHTIAKEGFAVLRYDPPGVGKSSGDSRFESLDDRVQEALAALSYLQTRADITPDRVGLWGISQGGWVIAKAAAENPQDVAFIISVSGAGVSVAEQQVWGVETQSRAAGLSEEDVSKAVLFARLLVDWQLSNPIYQADNEAAAAQLGEGPWQDFMELVYEPEELAPAKSFRAVLDILESVQDEPWAKALYLKTLYLPALRSIPQEMMASMKGQKDKDLLTDPKDFLPKVTAPVLAFFGENDQLVPAHKSAELYETYLNQAGNQNFKIVVLPKADHGLNGGKAAYWEILSEWLGGLFIPDQ